MTNLVVIFGILFLVFFIIAYKVFTDFINEYKVDKHGVYATLKELSQNQILHISRLNEDRDDIDKILHKLKIKSFNVKKEKK